MAEIKELLTLSFRLKDGQSELAQGCVAVLDTEEGVVAAPAAAGAGRIAGVLRDTSLTAGGIGAFQVAGVAKVAIADDVAVGDMLIVADTQGRVKPAGDGAQITGTGIVGRALSSASTAGSLVKCLLALPAEYHVEITEGGE